MFNSSNYIILGMNKLNLSIWYCMWFKNYIKCIKINKIVIMMLIDK